MSQRVRQAIVKAAASQLGVSYIKDARVPKAGFDCVQLIAWCYEQALGIPVDFPVQGACTGFTDTRILDYLQQLGAIKTTLLDCSWGDVIVWNYRDTPHHTGMIYPIYPSGSSLENELGVIHSCAKFGKVVAHPLSGEWDFGNRFNSVWTFEGILF